MDLIEIIPGLFLVPGENKARFPYSHSFLVEGDTCALLDTGCGEQTLDALRRERRIDMVISSHSHPDHVALNWKFDGTPVYAPHYAANTFGNVTLLSERFTEPGELATEWRHFATTEMKIKTALPTHTFADEHVFDFGKIKLNAVYTPGHTIDHMCFFEPTHGIMFVFDIDLTAFGPWYGHRESDIGAFEESIRKVIAFQPRVVVSSHKGVMVDNISARLEKFLGVFAERDQLLLDLLSRTDAVDELVGLTPFYQSCPYAPNLMRYWEEQMIRKHLARLIERGWVAETLDGKYAKRKM